MDGIDEESHCVGSGLIRLADVNVGEMEPAHWSQRVLVQNKLPLALEFGEAERRTRNLGWVEPVNGCWLHCAQGDTGVECFVRATVECGRDLVERLQHAAARIESLRDLEAELARQRGRGFSKWRT